ncbi:hypothetical protein HPB52_023816 [Rhipicephalus sanguineus]|uniref:Uncharacterized protein n=1 Tax=Rhipicephalus sanguineus TaxID=34632 RepID=A0A9D4PVL0_RHISA|nr:hypothetical protein HPB52_023816 [Rhipicephalus sanguineus]
MGMLVYRPSMYWRLNVSSSMADGRTRSQPMSRSVCSADVRNSPVDLKNSSTYFSKTTYGSENSAQDA